MPTNPVFTPVDNNGNVIGAAGTPSAVNVANSPTVFTVVQPSAVLYSEAAQSRTANGTTAAQTWTNNVAAAIVGVNVTAFTGGTNLVISLQQQDANGVWQTIGSSAAITAAGTATFSVGQGMATGAVLVSGGSYRLAWTLTGPFVALTFQLSVQGR
ncbi:hypothetical protein [Streptomyces sp. NPDC051173]|uniref:hypothetical protein n=1 Tax=Streptomyces sp. NPDC051173 TaxID=3155164 RepID=UPI00344DBE43